MSDEAEQARRSAYHKGNAKYPLWSERRYTIEEIEAALDQAEAGKMEEVGRLIVQDEGNPDTVRINLYAEETGRLIGSILVKRQHTARYALWLLQASMLRTDAQVVGSITPNPDT